MHEKRRDILRSLLAAPFGLAAALAAGAAPKLGATLALVDLPLLEGGTFKAAEVNDRVVAVYWWASWCPFCAEMSPHVERLWRDQRDRGLVVLGISIDRNAEAARAHRRKHGYTFPSALHGPSVEPSLPRPRSVPTTWVRDRKGRVVMAETGQIFPEDVAEIARFL